MTLIKITMSEVKKLVTNNLVPHSSGLKVAKLFEILLSHQQKNQEYQDEGNSW
jgi:hypothetical protein